MKYILRHLLACKFTFLDSEGIKEFDKSVFVSWSYMAYLSNYQLTKQYYELKCSTRRELYMCCSPKISSYIFFIHWHTKSEMVEPTLFTDISHFWIPSGSKRVEAYRDTKDFTKVLFLSNYFIYKVSLLKYIQAHFNRDFCQYLGYSYFLKVCRLLLNHSLHTVYDNIKYKTDI